MLTLALGVVAFTAVVLALVAALLVAKSRLAPAGEARILINDDDSRAVTARRGLTLLDALGNARVFVPSACGGKGTCATCKVVVEEGGGDLLPTERGLVRPAEARRGVRLSCQLKVAQDLRIRLPDAVFGAREWTCTLRSARNVATFIREFVLEVPEGEDFRFRAGGYVQITCPPHTLSYSEIEIEPRYRADWEKFGLFSLTSRVDAPLTRAFSMANYPEEKGIITLNVRIATPPPRSPLETPTGQVSSWLFARKPGDAITVSGPFGEFFARETESEMVFVGGGAGMAPLRSHIFDQLLRLHSKRKISFWYGARSLKEAFYVEDFDRLQREHDNFRWTLVLSEPLPEDEWTGPVGFIHNAVHDLYLRDHPAPEDAEYYLCGPPPMIAATTTMLEGLGVERERILYDAF
jgi:Na+-transporting NADH:ubiquinone oxidoreductase subunit F